MRWKWQNRQRFDKDKRRPISGRRCPAKSGLLEVVDIVLNAMLGCMDGIQGQQFAAQHMSRGLLSSVQHSAFHTTHHPDSPYRLPHMMRRKNLD